MNKGDKERLKHTALDRIDERSPIPEPSDDYDTDNGGYCEACGCDIAIA